MVGCGCGWGWGVSVHKRGKGEREKGGFLFVGYGVEYARCFCSIYSSCRGLLAQQIRFLLQLLLIPEISIHCRQ